MEGGDFIKRADQRVRNTDFDVLEKLDALLQPEGGCFSAKISSDVKHENGPTMVKKKIEAEIPQANMTADEKVLLYIEVLYTIKHKIGRTCNNHSSAQGDLYSYARRAFKLSDPDHHRLLVMASDEKPPIVILHVNVIEARNLEAKDANGFSDPYCMLGIVPGSRLGEAAKEQPICGEPKNLRAPGRKKGAFTKLSSSVRESFRKKEKKKVIPAKYIQVTSVQPCTLNPVWNEKFRFDLESIESDTLHLDVWDHDGESSVFDVAKTLNEVQSLKGLGRIFKDIAQSARTQRSLNADDFLGCLDVPLKDVPSAGIESWYALRRRSTRSHVRGELKLKLSLATREDRGVPEDCDWTETKQHRCLIEVFLAHELRRQKEHPIESSAALSSRGGGALPAEANTILHQHAVQGDLTECQSTACHWLAYSRLFPDWCTQCLPGILERLDALWSPGTLSRVEEELLSDSFKEFLEKVLKCIKCMQLTILEKERPSTDTVQLWLRCICKIQGLKLYRHCCPFAKDVTCELTLTLKAGTQAWYESMKSRLPSEDGEDKGAENEFRLLAGLCRATTTYFASALESYSPLFEGTVDIDYFSILFKVIDFSLADEVRKSIGNLAATADGPISPVTAAHSPGMRYSVSTLDVPAEQVNRMVAAFELYFPLLQLSKMVKHCTSCSEKLLLPSFQSWFSPLVLEWASLVRGSAALRIVTSTVDDKLLVVNPVAGCSWSAMEVSHYYKLIVRFWLSLEWKDADETFALMLKLLDIICYMISKYSETLHAKLKKEAYCDSDGQFNVHPKLCVALNDLCFVRNLLSALPVDLKLSAATKSLCSAQLSAYSHDESHVSNVVCSLVESCDNYVVSTVESVVSKVSDRIKPDIRRNLQLFCWSADSVPVQQALRPLLDYLESNLCILRKHMLSAGGLKQVTLRIWLETLKEAQACLKIDHQQASSAYYSRLHDAILVLLDFFQAGDNQVGLRDLKTDFFQRLQHLLWVQRRSTEELIAMFYKDQTELQKHQEATTRCLGVVGVKALYNAHDGLLLVEVVQCKNLVPLDANGFSDPYVTVELCPKHLFQNQPKKETSIKKKTLNPVFEDTFEFPVALDDCRKTGSTLHFTIMDYDFLMDNDFGGEAFLAMADVPGVTTHTSLRSLQQTKQLNLAILKPLNPEGTDILQVLAARQSEDREAREFLRMRKQVAVMAEESLSDKPMLKQ